MHFRLLFSWIFDYHRHYVKYKNVGNRKKKMLILYCARQLRVLLWWPIKSHKECHRVHSITFLKVPFKQAHESIWQRSTAVYYDPIIFHFGDEFWLILLPYAVWMWFVFGCCKYIWYFLREEVWILIWSDVEHVTVITRSKSVCIYCICLSVEESNTGLV